MSSIFPVVVGLYLRRDLLYSGFVDGGEMKRGLVLPFVESWLRLYMFLAHRVVR